MLNSLLPISKQEICYVSPDVCPTTVEAALAAMVKNGSAEKVGARKNTKYISPGTSEQYPGDYLGFAPRLSTVGVLWPAVRMTAALAAQMLQGGAAQAFCALEDQSPQGLPNR